MGALGLTRVLAVELAPHGILVNHIVPGAFDTLREGPPGRAYRVATGCGHPARPTGVSQRGR